MTETFPHPTDPGAVLIPLTRGLFAEVSRIDAEAVASFFWRATICRDGFYASRNVRRPDGRWTCQHMHALIAERMGIVAPEIDHINREKLDNRRSNLRGATRSQNGANTGLIRSNKTGFKGVCWDKSHQRWRVTIRVNGKQLHVGNFREIEDAAKAAKEAQLKHFGEFAS